MQTENHSKANVVKARQNVVSLYLFTIISNINHHNSVKMNLLTIIASLCFLGEAYSQCRLACSDMGWCSSYKTYCSHDANVKRNCPKMCGICDESDNTPKPPNNPSGCGKGSRSYPPALRFSGDKILGVSQGISGGSEAQPHSYPFLVRFHTGTGGSCTASIISDEWILTAGHCVATNAGQLQAAANKFTVYTAAHQQNDGMCNSVKKIIVHSEYRGACKGKGTDIALVQLEHKIQFNDKVQPICLPNSNDDFTKDSADNMVAAGWGWAHQNVRSTPLQHNVFTTKNISNKCFRDAKKELCAWGGYGSAACPGDSGGPLFFKRNGKWTQAGIAECGSHTMCGSVNWPSVYIHVPAHRDWIKRHTGL